MGDTLEVGQAPALIPLGYYKLNLYVKTVYIHEIDQDLFFSIDYDFIDFYFSQFSPKILKRIKYELTNSNPVYLDTNNLKIFKEREIVTNELMQDLMAHRDTENLNPFGTGGDLLVELEKMTDEVHKDLQAKSNEIKDLFDNTKD